MFNVRIEPMKESKLKIEEPLDGWRRQIDKIDENILQLLVERFGITEKVGIYKAKMNLPAFAPDREKAQEEKIRKLATENGMSPDVAWELFSLIIEKVKERHKQIVKEIDIR